MAADESLSEKKNSQDEPIGFAGVARQIARRSTDLVAISIIAVGGLTIGGRLSQWWSTDADDVTSASQTAGSVAGSTSPWGKDGTPVSFDLGDQPFRLRKQSVAGDRRQVAAALLGVCRELVAAAGVPSSFAGSETGGPFVPANERRLLAELEEHDPVAEKKQTWRLYAFDETLPLVLGTRRFPVGTAGEPRNNAAVDGPRVVCWGMAFPSAEKRWTLFAFHSPGGRVSPQSGDFALPPGSRRIMSLRAETGEALIGFDGAGPPEEWASFFDGWFRENGWRLSGGWKSSADGWTARYSPADDGPDCRVDVHFARTGGSKWNGLLDVIPSPKRRSDVGEVESRDARMIND